MLLSYGEKIITLCRETCRAVEDLQNLNGGTLTIGASEITGTYLLPRMIGLFRQKYPDVVVQLQIYSTRRTAWGVNNGQVDLAIIGGDVPNELQDVLKVIPYIKDELALILPANHPLSKVETIQKDDLYRLNFISLDSQSTLRRVIEKNLNYSGINTKRLNIEMELNSIEAVKNAVQAGLGAAFVSITAIEKEIKTKEIYVANIEKVKVKRTLSVIVNPNRYCSKASETFIKEILPRFSSYYEKSTLEYFSTSSLSLIHI